MRNSGVTLPVLGATIAGWMMGGLAVPALAEDAIPPAVQRRLEDLEHKVRTLERQQEVSEEVRTADKAKQTATVSGGADGFALKSTDGAFQLKLRGLPGLELVSQPERQARLRLRANGIRGRRGRHGRGAP